MTVDELELFALVVPASRCGVKWSDLKGDEQTRTCSRCAQRLHSVGSLSVDEAIALSRDDQARAKLFLRRDGTVKVRDCPSSTAAAFVPRMKLGWVTTLIFLLLYASSLIGLNFALDVFAGDEIRRAFGDSGRCCVLGDPPRGRKRSNASRAAVVNVQPQTAASKRSRK